MTDPITQARLRRVRASQDVFARDREDLVADVLSGANVEPGELEVNYSALNGDMPLIVLSKQPSNLVALPRRDEPATAGDPPFPDPAARIKILRRLLREQDFEFLEGMGAPRKSVRQLRRERLTVYWTLAGAVVKDSFDPATLRLEAMSRNEEWGASQAVLEGFIAVAGCAVRLTIAGFLAHCHGPAKWINSLVEAALVPLAPQNSAS